MKKFVLLFILVLGSACVFSQPYLDIARVSYAYVPEKGLNDKIDPLLSNFYSVSLLFPIELKKGGDAILLNPFFEHSQGTIGDHHFHVISQGLMTGFLKKSANKKWSLLTAFFLRRNKEAEKKVVGPWQYGGVILGSWIKGSNFDIKLGLYYNREYFRNMFMPLVGIDWKINDKNTLFGILPGSLVFEHKLNKTFFTGFTFHGLTSAYRLNATDFNYLRVNDNQAGLFLDTYIAPKLVFTTEAGYTAFRKYRFGFRSDTRSSYTDLKNDNFYIKASLAFRIQTR